MAFREALVSAATAELKWWKDKGCKECIPPCKSKVATYWRNMGPSLDGCSDQPWSAAFICFCMTTAGMPRTDFPYSIAHEAYIRWAVRNQTMNKPSKTYYGRRASEYAPKPGDMVAKSRAGANVDYDHIPDAFFTSHCDIVISVDGSVAQCVGGNVSNKVSITKYALDSAGKIVNPDSKNIICVMECRKP
jgi:hypothetical protein